MVAQDRRSGGLLEGGGVGGSRFIELFLGGEGKVRRGKGVCLQLPNLKAPPNLQSLFHFYMMITNPHC